MTTCRKCGADGLRWVQVDGSWKLYQNETLHTCGPFRRERAVAAAKQGVFTAPKEKRVKGPKPPEKVLEMPPPEADGNYSHPWFAFVDGPVPLRKQKQPLAKQQTFDVIVP